MEHGGKTRFKGLRLGNTVFSASTTMVEALAGVMALQWARSNWIHNVEIFTDFLMLTRELLAPFLYLMH